MNPGKAEGAPLVAHRPWPSMIAMGAFVLVAIAFLATSCFTLGFAFSAVGFEFQLDREEGFLLQQAHELRAGQSIYPTLETYPYTVGNYPPVYPLLYAAALTFSEGLPAGRAIVLVATLLLAGLLALLTWKWTREWPAPLLAPGLFLTTYDVGNWAAYARVDLPAVAFAAAGLFAFGRGDKRWQWAAAILLFLLAFFTKQTAILAPGALFLALLAERRWKHAGILAAILAGAALAGVALLSLITGGEFWRHTVTYNANVMEWWQLWKVWVPHLWRFDRWWYITAVALLAGLAPRWREAGLEAKTAAAYLLLGLLSIAQTAKAGAAENYLLEFHAALALATAAGAGALLVEMRRREGSQALRTATAAGVVILLLAVHLLHLWSWNRVLMRGFDARGLNASHAPVLLRVVEEPGEVLSEHPVFAILARKEVPYQPFIMRQLAVEGKWDQEPFVEDLRRARFGLVISLQDLSADAPLPGWTEQMRAAIVERYVLDEIIQPGLGTRYYLYKPRRR